MPFARWLAPLLLAAVAFHAVACDGALTGGDDAPSEDQPSLHYELSNGVPIPLLGMGIGNLAHEQIPDVVSTQLGAGVLLVDTARASNNERILATAVARASGRAYIAAGTSKFKFAVSHERSPRNNYISPFG